MNSLQILSHVFSFFFFFYDPTVRNIFYAFLKKRSRIKQLSCLKKDKLCFTDILFFYYMFLKKLFASVGSVGGVIEILYVPQLFDIKLIPRTEATNN